MELILIISISYLMGSIPFGLILTKIFLKKDIREVGSGNIGATNVLRTGNKVIGYLTLILDVLKAAIPVLYIKLNFPEFIYISSLSAFIGHVFPIWLKFKGGKGVATYIGILFSINYILGIMFAFSWLIVFFISKYSSLGSILSSMVIPIFIFLNSSYDNEYFFIIMFVLILYTHRENVKRLINKEESKTKIY
tara:strand:+ start:66 stop:644 length:579 start_codon:yes stop_codon:yes gene_type:complete